MYVHISSHLKEKLAWAVDKPLWVINTIMCYLKNSKSTKDNIVYVAMWPLVMYSNYFEAVSTVTNLTHFQVATYVCI